MRNLYLAGMAALLFICLGGCGDDESTPGDPMPPHETPPTLYDNRATESSSSLRLSVMYRDVAGDKPLLHQIVWDIGYGPRYNPLREGEGSHSSGMEYYLDISTSGTERLTEIRYHYEFDDGYGNQVRLPLSGEFSYYVWPK